MSEQEKPVVNVMMYPDELPVICETVRALPDDAQLLEFGSGGSTSMIASLLRGTQHLTTVEHNAEWLEKVREHLASMNLTDRVTQLFVPLPDFKGTATPEEETLLPNSEAYIDPAVDWSAVQWVLVDGVMRNHILKHLPERLSLETLVMVHDYVGREDWYSNVNLYNHVVTVHTLRCMTVGSQPEEWLADKEHHE